MTNKYDLETILWRNVRASMSSNIGGAIATGKTRFLTYIRVDRLDNVDGGSGCDSMEVAVASLVTGAGTLGHNTIVSDGHYKLLLNAATVTTAGAAGITFPDEMLTKEVQGSIENPILSVVGPNYMTLSNASDVSVAVFAQYFDA